MDEQARENIRKAFDTIRDYALENNMNPAAFLLVTQEGKLFVGSPLNDPTMIRGMLAEYVDQMGRNPQSHEHTELSW